jgi:hypothetical protein
MPRTTAIASLLCALGVTCAGPVLADDGFPHGIPRLNHVFVIMMENHGYGQVVSNPDEPFVNQLISSGEASYATNYFAVAHPSLTNYLEIVGGSNFNVLSDNAPNWHSATPCTPNLASNVPNVDNDAGIAGNFDTGTICPIAGTGADAATPAIDNYNETEPPFPYLANIDGVKSIPALQHVQGMTIADQLAGAGGTWKSYQESLPLSGADKVNYSNGDVSNLTNLTPLGINSADVVQDYAVKHNPFAYFKSVQEGTSPNLSLSNVTGFNGLYADLASGDVPNYAFIAPNQCNDQHGRGNGDAFCAFDFGINPSNSGFTYGTQAGLNPELIYQGDVTVQRLVSAIKGSPAWKQGRSAIVIVWDENDYSGVMSLPQPAGSVFPAPNQNRVLLTVETNYRHGPGVSSGKFYDHFSLLKSIEAGFGLPCLNHACDDGVQVMSDLFGEFQGSDD